jgi:hypothetical protein
MEHLCQGKLSLKLLSVIHDHEILEVNQSTSEFVDVRITIQRIASLNILIPNTFLLFLLYHT